MKELKFKKMTCMVSENKSLLESTTSTDFFLEHGCKVGACGMCKYKLVSGSVDHGENDILDEEETEGGIILVCQARPLTDCEIEDN